VFNLFLRLLPQLRIPLRGSKDDTELRAKLGLDTHVEDAKFVASWLAKLVLLTIIRRSADGGTPTSCPGLTPDDYAFLTLNGKAEAWDPNSVEGLSLVETKITILLFLASGAFIDTERFIPAVYAAADPNSRISSIGDDLLKRTTVSLEDNDVVKSLFEIYPKSRPALQTRILLLLSKSTAATTYPRQIIDIVQRGTQLGHPDIPPIQGLAAKKLRNAMFNFLNWVSRTGASSDLQQVAPVLVKFLQDYIFEQGWPIPNDKSTDEADLRALAYETLGSMAKTVPSLVREPKLSLVRWLFQSLTQERSSDSIFISIQGALASLLSVFSPPLDPELLSALRALLLEYMTQEEDEQIVRSARFATVRWANRCLEYDDIVGRWIDILAVGARSDERNDVVEEGNKGLVSRITL
jgi:proteasome component ECM29